jgi:predicted ATPase
MIHQHITKTALSPHELNPSIPKAVSDVIMKLMAKNAEDRYQSADALQADLRFISERYEMGASLDKFILGHTDNNSRFLIPEKLYGREEELSKLFSAFEIVKSNGGSAMLTVSGVSGVGKSRLVHEIQRPVVEARGRFATGKFDQYRRGTPFYAIIQALQDLVRQVLSESETTIEKYRTLVSNTIGSEANVLADVIPEIEMLLGPEVPSTEQKMAQGSMEREERFKSLLVKFVTLFGPKGRPLVLFFEDLQWSNYHELQAVISFAMEADSTSQSILIIGTYRSNEIDESHFLPSAIEQARRHGVLYQDIQLQQLSHQAISDMIKDTVRVTSIHNDFDMEALSEWVYSKTEGNAFFVTHMLRTLYDQGDLHFDFGQQQWHFKIPAEDSLPANVIDLIIRGLQQLPPQTQDVLKLAACIGSNRFTLYLLSVVYQHSLEETATDLWPALKAGLIVPTSNAYQIPLAIEPGSELSQQWMNTTNSFESEQPPSTLDRQRSEGSSNSASRRQRSVVVTYRFLHDKVQQSAMALIPEEERPVVHSLIGRHLLHRMTLDDQLDAYVFEICDQLNKAERTLTPDEKEHLIRLNLRAGRKALKATAFDGAKGYFQVAQELLGRNPWNRRRQLTMDVHLATVERMYAVQEFAEGISQ